MQIHNSFGGRGPGRLDLALESLFLLRERRRGISDHMVETARTSHWSGRTDQAEEAWLRAACAADDVFAMEKLGERLLESSSMGEGQRWLTKAAELGSPFAMAYLGEWLLDESGLPLPQNRGEYWLRAAADKGYAFASVSLSVRLLMGDGTAQKAEEGERILRENAWEGNLLAILLLGARLLAGRDIQQDRNEGLRWLQTVARPKLDDLTEYGLYIHNRSLSAPTLLRKQYLATEAAWLFFEASRMGSSSAGTNLAYLLRRGEVPPGSFPSLDELLSPLVQSGDAFATVNHALRLAAGMQCSMDWREADRLFAKAGGAPAVREWWQEQARLGDPEGDLVVAWSCLHNGLPDPDRLPAESRIIAARKGGWAVPDWLSQAAVNQA